jgi:hypothetical protein
MIEKMKDEMLIEVLTEILNSERAFDLMKKIPIKTEVK